MTHPEGGNAGSSVTALTALMIFGKIYGNPSPLRHVKVTGNRERRVVFVHDPWNSLPRNLRERSSISGRGTAVRPRNNRDGVRMEDYREVMQVNVAKLGFGSVASRFSFARFARVVSRRVRKKESKEIINNKGNE